jgi:hypothetical protein
MPKTPKRSATRTPRGEPVHVEMFVTPPGGERARYSGDLVKMGPIEPPPPIDTGTLGLTFVRQIALPPLDMQYTYGDITGRIVGDKVRLLMTGSEAVSRSPIYELEVTDDPIATFIQTWPEPYHGKRGTWILVADLATTAAALWAEWERRHAPDWYAAWAFWQLVADKALKDGLDPQSYTWFDFSTGSTPALNGGHYFHPGTGLFYVTYADSYNVSGRPDWNCLAVKLHDDSTTETWGPFRFRLVDGDGGIHYGPRAIQYLREHPETGDLLGAAALTSGNVGCPWGPNLAQLPAAKWMTATTPAGPDPALDLVCDTRYLYGYYMGLVIDGLTGIAREDVRSGRRGKDPYIYEPFDTLTNFVNPTAYDGIGSWTDNDSLSGFVPLENRVLFFAGVAGSPIQDPQSPMAAHIWYATSMNAYKCTHGFDAVPPGITGPVSTARFPWATGYTWTALQAARRGDVLDWQVAPIVEENLETTYGITTAPVDCVGCAKMVGAGFFDARTRRLYTIAHGADRGTTYWGLVSAFIHEWQVA